MVGEIPLQRWLAAVLLAAAFVWAPQDTSAQISGMVGGKANTQNAAASEIVLPDELTPEQVDEILARLTDAQARRLLKGQLDKVAKGRAAAKKGGGGLGVLLVQIRHSLEKFTAMLQKNAALVSKGTGMVPGDATAALYRVTGTDGLSGVISHLARLFALIAVGGLVYWLVRRLTRESRHRLEKLREGALSDRLAAGLLRTLFDFLAVAAFAVVTIGLTAIFFSDNASTRSFLLAYITGALLILLVGLVSRFLLAPRAASLRILPFADQTARFIHRWLLIFATVEGLTWLTAGLLILSGIPLEAHLIIVLITGAIAAGLLIAMIVSGRHIVARSLRGSTTGAAAEGTGAPGLGAQLAGTWHIFAILYVVVVWALWATSMLARGQTSILAAVGSVGIIVVLPICDRVTHGILTNMFGSSQSDGETSKAHYIGIIQKVIRIVLGALAAVLLLEMWGLEIFGGGSAGSVLWEASFDIAAAMLLAYLGWNFIKVGIDRNLATREVDGRTIEPSPRAKTLLPLIRKFFVVVLVVVTVMIILSALGVAIGPLLAGAGVVGLAIGFGAQTLVKDIVAGVFFLIDDAFRVGEYIEMGDIRGEVEAISLRSLRLRHHRGAIHTIPFGELKSVTNYNRDWTIYKMTFRVPFDTDIDHVKKIFKKIGKEMMADEELGPKLLEPLKSQGVMEIDDSAMLIRAKFMCKPREQFILRREAYKRIKAAFNENGIEFARRKVEVHAPSTAAGSGPEGAGAMTPGAAAAALEEPSNA